MAHGLETILVSVRGGSPTYRSEWVTRDLSVCETTPVLDEEDAAAAAEAEEGEEGETDGAAADGESGDLR